jgi:hypothetical protein
VALTIIPLFAADPADLSWKDAAHIRILGTPPIVNALFPDLSAPHRPTVPREKAPEINRGPESVQRLQTVGVCACKVMPQERVV